MYNFCSHILQGILPNCGLTYYNIDKCNCNNTYDEHDVFLVIRGGSSTENASEHGISHLLEHTIVLGVLYPEGQDFFSFPAYVQAFTNFNETVFQFKLKNDGFSYFSQCIYAIKNIFLSQGLYERMFILAKNEVENELDRMDFSINEALNAIPHTQSRNLKLPAGNLSCISQLQFKDVIEHHRNWYLLEESSIIISSRFKTTKVVQLLADVFENNISMKDSSWNEPEISSEFLQKKDLCFEKRIPCITLFSVIERNFQQLDKYMLLSIGLGIALDALAIKIKRFCSARFVACSVEIIGTDLWLVRLEIHQQDHNVCNDILNLMDNPSLNKHDYINAKRRYTSKALRVLKKNKTQKPIDVFAECVANFLYDEPVFDVLDEAKYILRALPEVNFDIVRSKFDAIVKNLVTTNS